MWRKFYTIIGQPIVPSFFFILMKLLLISSAPPLSQIPTNSWEGGSDAGSPRGIWGRRPKWTGSQAEAVLGREAREPSSPTRDRFHHHRFLVEPWEEPILI